MKTNNGNLTKKQIGRMYRASLDVKEPVIQGWKMPFLWILWFFVGYTTQSENIKMYWVNFRSVLYLLKSKDL